MRVGSNGENARNTWGRLPALVGKQESNRRPLYWSPFPERIEVRNLASGLNGLPLLWVLHHLVFRGRACLAAVAEKQTMYGNIEMKKLK